MTSIEQETSETVEVVESGKTGKPKRDVKRWAIMLALPLLLLAGESRDAVVLD